MSQIAFVLKNLLVNIVRLILVQMHDFHAVRQDMSPSIAKASLRSRVVEHQDRVPALAGPGLQLQQDDVDPVAVPAKRAASLQQLLKDLVVRSKFDMDWNSEVVAPEHERILKRFRRE